MLKRISDKRREDQGFTLIELLVVIVILGILAAVVVFAVGGITDKGSNAAKATDEKTIQTAQEAFYANTPASDPAVYATEKTLVEKKSLAGYSTTHNICLAKSADPAVDKKSYKVVGSDVTTPLGCGGADAWYIESAP